MNCQGTTVIKMPHAVGQQWNQHQKNGLTQTETEKASKPIVVCSYIELHRF